MEGILLTEFKALLEIIRLPNGLMGGLTTAISILTVNKIIDLTVGVNLSTISLIWLLVIAYITYVFQAAAGNVVNDIFDIEVDKINRPNRALPRGALTIRQAKIYSVLLALGGSICAFVTSIPAGIIATTFSLVGFVYASRAKLLGIWGNFTVSFSFAFGLIYGSLITYYAVLNTLGLPLLIWLYFLTAFLILQGREVIKGMEDVKGDRVRGVKTIALVYGFRTASVVAAFFNIMSMICFTSAWFLSWFGWSPLPNMWYPIFLLPGNGIALASTILILMKPFSSSNQNKASFYAKIGSLIGLLAFLVGAL
ncbi:MAG: geranylgeranylglycerol-phosphate geranylgeranyltransferase [Candidatus Hodarchaeota archaeon]